MHIMLSCARRSRVRRVPHCTDSERATEVGNFDVVFPQIALDNVAVVYIEYLYKESPVIGSGLHLFHCDRVYFSLTLKMFVQSLCRHRGTHIRNE